MRPPGAHSDIDLLYPAESWHEVDMLIAVDQLDEIAAKRSSHKRAMIWRGVMIELFLVRSDSRGPYTVFWGAVRQNWPADVFGFVEGEPVASVAALRRYRDRHRAIHVAAALRTV